MKLFAHGASPQGDRLSAGSMQKVVVNLQSHAPLVIGRIYETEFTVELLQRSNPQQLARWYVNAIQAPVIRLNPHIRFWEGPNEIAIGDAHTMSLYAAFEAERTRILRYELGVGAAVGCFATGNPQYNFLPFFQPALDAVKECGGVLAIHEYGNTLPVATQIAGAFLLGFFKMWLALDPDILIVITEFGTDNVPPDGKPWRQLDWSDDEYAGWGWGYELELRKYPRVLSAAWFCFNGGERWADYELENSNVAQRILEFEAANPEEVITNQRVINAFWLVFGPVMAPIWMGICGLTWMWSSPTKRKERAILYVNQLPLWGKDRVKLRQLIYKE